MKDRYIEIGNIRLTIGAECRKQEIETTRVNLGCKHVEKIH